MIWTGSKINYAFVFEFDARHVLDWRQLAEVRCCPNCLPILSSYHLTENLAQIPCFCMFLLGLILFLNFRWTNEMYIYFPVILIATTVAILFLPVRVFYHRSRKWWAYSNVRTLETHLPW